MDLTPLQISFLVFSDPITIAREEMEAQQKLDMETRGDHKVANANDPENMKFLKDDLKQLGWVK